MAGADGPYEPASPAHDSSFACEARWPRQSFLELGALPGAVPCARLHTMAVLWEWHMPALADAAELVVSELMTNAVRASSARLAGAGLPVVWLRLSADQRQLLVEVSDSDPDPPVPAGLDPERDGGRGLLLVEAASAQWGYYYPAPEPGPGVCQPYCPAPTPGGPGGPEEAGAMAGRAAVPAPTGGPGQPKGKIVWALLSAP